MTKAKKNKKVKNTGIKSIEFWVQLIWIMALSSVLIAGLVFLVISKLLLPDTSELENPRYDLATKIISADNRELGKAFRLNREWLKYEEINPNIINALVATEDERYFQHSGIDARGTIRAFAFLGKRGGASTITQQLAKLFFTDRSSSFIKRSWQKLKEWVIAVEFEKRYTKEEILAMYLNKYDFIYESIGIATASKNYFGKNQKDLDIAEAAILVGMLKNPDYYNPKKNPNNSTRRRNVVLKQMVRNGFISAEDRAALIKDPIDLKNFKRQVYNVGPAPYFKSEMVKWVKKVLEEPAHRKPDGTKYNIYTDGLKIYTTIDSRIQKYAEESMQEHMAKLQKRYFDVWKNRDPWKTNVTSSLSKEQKKRRDNLLKRDMRNSERFKGMRKTYLDKVTNDILTDFPKARLKDVDIFRLFNAENDKVYIKRSIRKKQFSEERGATYREILDSEHWPKLKAQWSKLRKAADQAFRKKRKIRIYDYATGKTKKVDMTPLDSIKYHQQILQMGNTVLDSKTGEVKAWVGGVNHRFFKYDHVTSNRQVGSTFKPFIYATAIIDQAMSPCSKFQDIKTCIPAKDRSFNLMKSWCPDNSNNKFTQEWMDLRTALKKSTNSLSAQLMIEIGSVERVRSLVQNLGIDKNKVAPYPSMCLGTAGLSVMDMAGAYTAFANNGTYSQPRFVTRIEDKDGKVIYSSVPNQKKAVNPAFNHVIVDLLKSVAAPIAGNFKSPVAGKTGTTNDYRDGWFVGFTPNLVLSTWVGGDKEFIRFLSLRDGAGSKMARPMFVSLLKKIENDSSLGLDYSLDFEQPAKEVVELDCSKYDEIIKADEEAKVEEVDQFDEEF